MDGTYYKFYLNGTLTATNQYSTLPANTLKGYFSIGAQWSLATLILDDLKFFRRNLNITEIHSDMNSF